MTSLIADIASFIGFNASNSSSSVPAPPFLYPPSLPQPLRELQELYVSYSGAMDLFCVALSSILQSMNVSVL